MKVNSVFFGEQEIDPETIITFPQGIPGFEQYKEYKLFNTDEDPTVYLMQPIDAPDVIFSVALPESFNFAYQFTISDEDAALLQANAPEEISILLLLARNGEEADTSEKAIRANLHGPILLNAGTRLAMQKVLPKTEQVTLIRAIED